MHEIVPKLSQEASELEQVVSLAVQQFIGSQSATVRLLAAVGLAVATFVRRLVQ